MKYFITYGDDAYAESKKRLVDQARKSGYFDKIMAYGKKDLSEPILSSPLLKFKRGGGYWLWKPYIIRETLKGMAEGDLLVYADSGCSVYKSKEWYRYFNQLKKYDLLAFLVNVRVEQYTRKNIIDRFQENGKYWTKKYQVASGFLILKKTGETVDLINSWLDFMEENTKCVIDVPNSEIKNESPYFIENRHDQSIFSALVYKYQKNAKIKLLLNHFEGGRDKLRSQALIASRISDERSRGQSRSFIKAVLLFVIAEPLRYLRQTYWTIRNNFSKKM